jgi:hypothetical protein
MAPRNASSRSAVMASGARPAPAEVADASSRAAGAAVRPTGLGGAIPGGLLDAAEQLCLGGSGRERERGERGERGDGGGAARHG